MEDIITPQSIPISALITALHELRIRKTFEIVDTRSYMQLSDLNSKPHGRKSLQNIIDCVIGVQFCPPTGSHHYQQLCIGQFHDPNHINCEQKKKIEIKTTKLSGECNRTTKAIADQI